MTLAAPGVHRCPVGKRAAKPFSARPKRFRIPSSARRAESPLAVPNQDCCPVRRRAANHFSARRNPLSPVNLE
jgi:hypothetical protein